MAGEENGSQTKLAPDSRINSQDGRKYWQGVGADVNGMLGGFPYVSKADLQGSKNFLAKLGLGNRNGLKRIERALEGGAGYVAFSYRFYREVPEGRVFV